MNYASVKLMEDFIECGKYPYLKQSEKKITILTQTMKERLSSSEEKRHVFTRYGIVGRFVAKKIYDTDIVSLNEYFHDIGILTQVIEIDTKKILDNILYHDLIQDFRLPDTFYLKPAFNKAGKALFHLPETYQVTSQWGLEDIARALAIVKPQYKKISAEYERLKKKIVHLSEIKELQRLPKEKRKPIKYKYGSLSIVANAPKYDVSAIYDYFGESILIEYGVPNAKKLERFILNGTITAKEIEQFKTIKDIRLDFMVMSLEDEQKMLDLLNTKVQTAAINRMA